MKYKLLKRFFFVLLFALFSFKQATAVTVPSDWKFIPKGTETITTFRLLFVTSNTTQAVETEIEYYNTFVQNLARTNSALAGFANEFKVIGSTSATNARDNTNTNPASQTGYPIYFLNGHKVADDYVDFYDGDWILPATKTRDFGFGVKIFTFYNELGEGLSFPALHNVWTGSNVDGTKRGSNYLGSNGPHTGQNRETAEFSESSASNALEYRLYGLSPSITIDPNFATYTISSLTISVPNFIIQGDDFNGEVTATGLNSTGTINLNNFISRPTVNTNKLGRNTVTYTIADSAGSETLSESGVVYVVSKNKLDIDNNGIAKANSDGLMIKKYILNRQAFAKNLIGKGATLKTETEINAYLDFIDAENIFNISGNLDKNDSEIILRYLIGVRGFGLTNGLTFSGTRTTSASITQYLNNLRNGN